jgi:VanZ family protein
MSVISDERAPGAAALTRRPVVAALGWIPVGLWAALILSLSGDQFSGANTASWLSTLPFVRAFELSPTVLEAANLIVRKCAHFVEYAVLGMLTFRALRITWRRSRGRRLVVIAVALAALCATVDELHQHVCTTHRTGAPKDVVLDTVGALAGAVVGATYLYRRLGRRSA